MSITNKVRAGFAFCLLIVGVIGAVSYWSATQVPETSRMVEHTLQVMDSLKGVTADLSDLEFSQRSYILMHQRESLELFRRSKAKLNQELGRARKLTTDSPGQQRRLDELEALVSQRVASAEKAIQLRDQQGFNAARESVKSGVGQQLSERSRRTINEMEAEEARLLELRHRLARDSAQTVTFVSRYGVLVAFLFVAAASVLIARHITGPVGRLVEATKQLGGGSLGYRVGVETRDELGLLARALNRMADRLEKSQNELQQQTNILQSVLTSIADGVVVADTSGKFLFYNPAARRILGTGPTESGPGGWSEHFGVFLPDMTTPFPSEDLPLARAIRGEPSDDVEMFIRHAELPEGVWLSITGRPLQAEDGRMWGGVVVFNDTTARRRSQEELKSERNLLRTLIDQLPELIFLKDVEGRYLLANAALMRVQGASSLEEVVGRDDFAFYPKEQAEQYRRGDAEVFQSGEPLINHEEPVVDPDGNLAWISTTKVPLRDAHGAITGLVGISHEITERRLNEERIRKLNENLSQRAAELETVNRELEAFSYSVSHDLRAPLRHIDGFAELLVKRAGPVLDERSRRYVDTISQSAKELGQLIDDLLVFSRMGRTAMKSARFSLEQLARQVVREVEREAKGRSVTWTFGELPMVEGDSAMLRLVFVNLFSNALKYTRTRVQAKIEVGSSNGHPGENVIFVRDNGVGFDMQYVEKLFGVFQRLHSAKDFEGTGIGLANVRRIIHRHGGRTWAEGIVDGGAAFYFSLPKKTEGTAWLS